MISDKFITSLSKLIEKIESSDLSPKEKKRILNTARNLKIQVKRKVLEYELKIYDFDKENGQMNLSKFASMLEEFEREVSNIYKEAREIQGKVLEAEKEKRILLELPALEQCFIDKKGRRTSFILVNGSELRNMQREFSSCFASGLLAVAVNVRGGQDSEKLNEVIITNSGRNAIDSLQWAPVRVCRSFLTAARNHGPELLTSFVLGVVTGVVANYFFQVLTQVENLPIIHQ